MVLGLASSFFCQQRTTCPMHISLRDVNLFENESRLWRCAPSRPLLPNKFWIQHIQSKKIHFYEQKNDHHLAAPQQANPLHKIILKQTCFPVYCACMHHHTPMLECAWTFLGTP